jgi:hypothetical protein
MRALLTLTLALVPASCCLAQEAAWRVGDVVRVEAEVVTSERSLYRYPKEQPQFQVDGPYTDTSRHRYVFLDRVDEVDERGEVVRVTRHFLEARLTEVYVEANFGKEEATTTLLVEGRQVVVTLWGEDERDELSFLADQLSVEWAGTEEFVQEDLSHLPFPEAPRHQLAATAGEQRDSGTLSAITLDELEGVWDGRGWPASLAELPAEVRVFLLSTGEGIDEGSWQTVVQPARRPGRGRHVWQVRTERAEVFADPQSPETWEASLSLRVDVTVADTDEPFPEPEDALAPPALCQTCQGNGYAECGCGGKPSCQTCFGGGGTVCGACGGRGYR